MSAPDLAACPGLPRDEGGPVFRAPWEAQAFGMTVTLHEQGHFTWREWTERLSRQIGAAGERGEVDDGSRYYEYWLAALESLVTEKGLLTATQLGTRKGEWDEAARSTPHGQPIVLRRR